MRPNFMAGRDRKAVRNALHAIPSSDGNRNSLFDTEAPRNDAMLFGEHVSPVPDFQQYLSAGMRLCNQPLAERMKRAAPIQNEAEKHGQR